MAKRVRVTRAHHPLLGQEFEVLKVSAKNVVVQLPDGSRLRLPRQWTDDGSPVAADGCEEANRLTIDGLQCLLRLVRALRERS